MADVVGIIDLQQFGCLKETTIYCLFYVDFPDKHIRLLFLDYTKAFHSNGHNALRSKLIDIGVRRSMMPWIISFLPNRKQTV